MAGFGWKKIELKKKVIHLQVVHLIFLWTHKLALCWPKMAGSSCPLKRLASSRGLKRLNLLHQFVETLKTKIASTEARNICNKFSLVPSKKPVTRENWDKLSVYFSNFLWYNLQLHLCQKLLFLHQLTHNWTSDCSLNYKFNTWKFQAQTWGIHVVYKNCFWHSKQFLYTTCSPHVLQKEELLTKM
jgi:hypothetical protein